MSEKPRGTQDLLEQFRELGAELERSIRRAWESNEGQEVREQIGNGLRELNHQLSRLAEDVQSSETYREMQKRVKDAIESPQVEEATQSIERELGEALSTLNDLLNKLIKSVPGPRSRQE